MSTLKEKEKETLDFLMKNGLLAKNGILATTFCAAPRVARFRQETLGDGNGADLIPGIKKLVSEIGEKNKYQFSNRSTITAYACTDGNRKATEMITGNFICTRASSRHTQ